MMILMVMMMRMILLIWQHWASKTLKQLLKIAGSIKLPLPANPSVIMGKACNNQWWRWWRLLHPHKHIYHCGRGQAGVLGPPWYNTDVKATKVLQWCSCSFTVFKYPQVCSFLGYICCFFFLFYHNKKVPMLSDPYSQVTITTSLQKKTSFFHQ